MNPRLQALGRLPAGRLNVTEAEYAAALRLEELSGRILWHRFEAIKLRLADSTFYTPDFAVLLTDGTIELHEVKGFWTDDARVKTKVAAALYPLFRFVAITKRPKKHGGGWAREIFPPHEEAPRG